MLLLSRCIAAAMLIRLGTMHQLLFYHSQRLPSTALTAPALHCTQPAPHCITLTALHFPYTTLILHHTHPAPQSPCACTELTCTTFPLHCTAIYSPCTIFELSFAISHQHLQHLSQHFVELTLSKSALASSVVSAAAFESTHHVVHIRIRVSMNSHNIHRRLANV